MKRFLSILLAISMLAAFAPAVSAAEATQPNFTIKYDIGGIMTKYTMQPTSWGSTLLHMANVRFNHTDGFFEYVVADPIVNNTLSSVEYTPGTKTISINKNTGYITFKINVPQKGDYKLRMDHDLAKQGAYVDVIIDGTTVGTYNCYNENAKANWFGNTGANNHTQSIAKVCNAETNELGEDAVFPLDAGEHTITFKIKATLPVAASYRGSIGTFELISGDGNGNAIVSGSIDEPFELDTLTNPSKPLTVSGYLSSTCEAIETFAYSSSPEGVVEVSETGVVTALSAGTATITASAGTVNSLNTTVTVTETDPDAYAVTYDIGGTITKYGMQKQSWGASKLHMSNVKYLHTNGFFEYVAANPTVNGTSDNAEYQAGTKTIAMNKADGYVTFKIKVPADGDYKLWMDHDLALQGGYVDVYIDNSCVGSYSCYNSAASKNWFGLTGSNNHTQSVAKVVESDGTLSEEATFPLTAGEHTIKFQNRTNTAVASAIRGSVGTFKLIKGGSANVIPMHGFATVSDSNGVPVTSLLNGQAATANAAVYTTDGVAAVAATTLESSDPGVLAVNGTTVTAVGQGKAQITATVEYEGVPYEITSNEILVTDPSITNNTVSVYAAANIDGITIETSIDGYTPGVIGSISANTQVTLTAPTENIGDKVFRGWMRGSEDNGVWISKEPTLENIRLLTHTFFTAVYEEQPEEDKTTVEFWNWSGQYLGNKEVTKGDTFSKDIAPEPHPLTGYTFSHWSVDDGTPITSVTNAVAQFAKTAGRYTVSVPDGVTGAGSYEFDTEVTLTSEKPVYWINNGKTVDFGETYSFYVWENTEITVSDIGNKGPRVALHKHNDYGTYMLEYDNGDEVNKRIIEAGILFGDGAKITGFNSKATSKKLESHGQFTAVPYNDADKNAAVGYIIYLDGGVPRVLYAYEN